MRQSHPPGRGGGLDGALAIVKRVVGVTWLQPRSRSTLLVPAGVREWHTGPLCHMMAEMPGTQTLEG